MGTPGDIKSVSLARDVQPIFDAKCTNCHAENAFAVRSGIPLLLTEGLSHEEMVNVPSAVDDSLTFVVPGDPDASYLIEKMASDAPTRGTRMPLFGAPLTDDELETIRVWIQEGAADN